MGALARIFSARHDDYPLRGMSFVGIGWPDYLNNTLSYSEYCQENYEGRPKDQFHAADCGETITHNQNRNFSFDIRCSFVGSLSKILVPYFRISGLIDMARG